MLYTGYMLDQPVVVRYPRGKGPGVPIEKQMHAIEIGKAVKVRSCGAAAGRRCAILAFGSMVEEALQIADEIDATVYDMRFVKPIDRQAVTEAVKEHDLVVTMEENVVIGGAGDACLETLASEGIKADVLQIGIPDRFIEQGTQMQLWHDCGMNKESVLKQIQERLKLEQAEP